MNRMSSRKMSQIDLKGDKYEKKSKTSRDDTSLETIRNAQSIGTQRIKGIDFRKTISRENVQKSDFNRRLLPALDIKYEAKGRSN